MQCSAAMHLDSYPMHLCLAVRHAGSPAHGAALLVGQSLCLLLPSFECSILQAVEDGVRKHHDCSTALLREGAEALMRSAA